MKAEVTAALGKKTRAPGPFSRVHDKGGEGLPAAHSKEKNAFFQRLSIL